MSPKLHFREYSPDQLTLFPQRIDEHISQNDPVRLVSSVIDKLDLSELRKLYKEQGRSPYHPKMMLKVIIYAYMNNIYSCRKIEKLLYRDTHYIWLSGNEKPDYITINRFRTRVKEEINQIFTQLVHLLVAQGFISLDVAYVDGTKIESKANKYTFVWRKTVEKNKAKLQEKIRILLQQIDESIAQDNAMENEEIEITPEQITDIIEKLKENLSTSAIEVTDKVKKSRKRREKANQAIRRASR